MIPESVATLESVVTFVSAASWSHVRYEDVKEVAWVVTLHVVIKQTRMWRAWLLLVVILRQSADLR